MPDIVSLVASLNPPSDSMARGIKDMLAAWQAVDLCVHASRIQYLGN